jgi:transposase-like protein
VAVARSSKAEAAIAVTTAAFVITIGVLQAIIVAVVLSVADIIRRAARPADAVLGWSVKDDRYVDVSDHPDAGITSGVVVYRIQDRLFFANATSSNAGLRWASLITWTHRLKGRGDGRDTQEVRSRFPEGAVRLVRETGKPIAEVARDLGINAGTLGNWVNAGKRRRGDGTGALDEDERAELARLRRENAELAMERDVLSAAWPSGSRTRWGGSGGRADRRPEGRSPDPMCGGLPGAGGVPVLVLQVGQWAAATAG